MQRQSRAAVLVVCRNYLLREGLAHTLRRASFYVAGSAATVEEIINCRLGREKAPLLVIGAGDNPYEAADQIRLFKQRYPTARVALLAEHFPIDAVVAAFVAGANVHLRTQVETDVFIKALELIMLGETILPIGLLSYIGNRLPPQHQSQLEHFVGPIEQDGKNATPTTEDAAKDWMGQDLSPRETSILRLIAGGDPNKVIARKMKIAEATVKVHVKAILRKIRVNNRTQAAIWAVNKGLSEEHTSVEVVPLPALNGSSPMMLNDARRADGS